MPGQAIPGLPDEDLRKPDHDEILLWLDANIEPILNPIIYPGLTEEQIAVYCDEDPTITKTWQQPIMTPAREIVGFVDLTVRYERNCAPDDDVVRVFFFDVRTEIPSLGELIREVNVHRTYLGIEQSWFHSYILVSPDDRFTTILQDQDIQFLPYDAAK